MLLYRITLMVCENIFKNLYIFNKPSFSNHKSYGAEILREGSPYHTCHVSGVTCHMSRVKCHLSQNTCHISFYKVVELVRRGSDINNAYPFFLLKKKLKPIMVIILKVILNKLIKQTQLLNVVTLAF